MAIGTISEELKAAPDYLFDGATVPQNTSLSGNETQVGGTQAELEIVAVVGDTAIGLADTTTLTLKVQGASAVGGSYADVQQLYTVTASGATVVAAGTELGRYVWKPSDPMFAKPVVTTTDAAATGTIDVYIRRVAR